MNLLDSNLPAQSIHPVDREWSEYQQAIFSAAEDPSLNILIQARAGSGKSTTLVAAMGYAPGSSLFLAFNKAIAEEIRPKVGSSGDVKTLNALGHGLMMRNARSSELDARKVINLLKGVMGEGNQDYKDFAYTLSRAVGLMKNCAFGLDGKTVDVQSVIDLIDSYQMDIPFDRLAALSTYALRAFELSIQHQNTFDFDDQLYLPLLNGWAYPFYSNVFVDECQDLSPIQHLMLQRMAEAGSRIIAVGDSHQAIYGFRGALTDSMSRLQKRFSMKELPLSISYRCALSIIAEAQQYCPDILAREGAPQGLVIDRNAVPEYDDGETAEVEDPKLFLHGHLVLCRNNAPLFRAILSHIRAKSPCRVLSNFLDSFQGFILGFKVKTTRELLSKLDDWLTREKEAAEKKGFKGKIAGLKDKYETTKLLCEEFQWVEEMISAVKQLGEGRVGPIFATVHKSKGLEAESVYILRPDLMPSPFATTEDARQQEANLIYVAITRAKLSLTWGVSPKEW